MKTLKMPLFLRRIGWPLVLVAVVAGAVFLLPRIGVPTRIPRIDPATRQPVDRDYGAVAIGIAAALLVARFLDYAVFDLGFRLRRRPAAPALLRQLVGLLVFGIGVALVFRVVLSMSLTAVLTTSAILTAVIGLALQDTLGNLFAGLALHLEKTVQVGDMVRSGETFGTVEELSWRAIKLRTMEGNLLLIPNSIAGREHLEVFPRPGRPIARTLRVGLEFEVSPARAREVLETSVRNLRGLAAYPEPVALVKEYQDFALVYELRYWLEDFGRYLELDSQVRERVWYSLDRAGLRISLPVIRQHQYAAGPLTRVSRDGAVRPALDKVTLLTPLSSQERDRLAGNAVERRYGAGEVIVREGETGSSMFLVESGRVGVSIHGAGGDSRKLAILDPGSSFGEISLLTGEPRTATVRALTESWLIEVGKDCLAPILQANPSLIGALEKTIEERRHEAAQLYDASREELAAADVEESNLAARIRRFFGMRR